MLGSEDTPREVINTYMVFISSFCSLFQLLLCMPGAGPGRKWRCRGHISHFAPLPRGISPNPPTLLPIRAHWGGAAAKNPSPCLPLPLQHTTHPPTWLGGRGVSRAPSVHPAYATDLPQLGSKEKCTWVHSCREEAIT